MKSADEVVRVLNPKSQYKRNHILFFYILTTTIFLRRVHVFGSIWRKFIILQLFYIQLKNPQTTGKFKMRQQNKARWQLYNLKVRINI